MYTASTHAYVYAEDARDLIIFYCSFEICNYLFLSVKSQKITISILPSRQKNCSSDSFKKNLKFLSPSQLKVIERERKISYWLK